MGQVLGRVLGTDPERSKTVCFHEVDVQKPSVGQGRCSQNGSYFDGMGSRARKPRLGRQRGAPGLHSGPKEASGAGWLAPALEGRRGIRRAGRRGAAWVKSPRDARAAPSHCITATVREAAAERQRARALGAVCVPGSVPALGRVLGAPREPLPVLAPFIHSVPGPVISGAFPGSPLFIVTASLPGGHHHPHAKGDGSGEAAYTADKWPGSGGCEV